MTVLCLDPGLRGCGVSEYSDDGTLQRAAYVKSPVLKGADYAAYQGMGHAVRQWWTRQMPFEPKRLVIEHPRVYPGAAKVDLNDLLAVVSCGTAVAMCFICPAETLFPSEWKGNVQKSVMTARIHSKLTTEELPRLEPCPRSVAHNMLDSVGIGLHIFGRLRTRVFPGATP